MMQTSMILNGIIVKKFQNLHQSTPLKATESCAKPLGLAPKNTERPPLSTFYNGR